MLKLIAILLATLCVAVHCDSPVGAYLDHPELVDDSIIKSLVRYVTNHISETQNLALDNVKITSVQTQVVTGINYKFIFTGETNKGGSNKLATCHAQIYVHFDLSIKINKAQCNLA